MAVTLGSHGKEVDLEVQGINSQRFVSSKHINKCVKLLALGGKRNFGCMTLKQLMVQTRDHDGLNLNWSFHTFHDLDIQNTDTKPVQVIIGTNNSDLILPRQIVKSMRGSNQDQCPYAIESWLDCDKLASRDKCIRVYSDESAS